MADNASHALASSATVRPTSTDEEEVVVIRIGWTRKKKRRKHVYMYMCVSVFDIRPLEGGSGKGAK